jgi:hypothetical protein
VDDVSQRNKQVAGSLASFHIFNSGSAALEANFRLVGWFSQLMGVEHWHSASQLLILS